MKRAGEIKSKLDYPESCIAPRQFQTFQLRHNMLEGFPSDLATSGLMYDASLGGGAQYNGLYTPKPLLALPSLCLLRLLVDSADQPWIQSADA